MEKSHVVCVPLPFQGHINSMLKLAKLLHYRGLHVTFVNSDFNHQRLLKSRGHRSLDGLPEFRFETIPDGLPPSDNLDASQDVPAVCLSTKQNCLAPFRHLLSKLNHTSDVPPVTSIVSDGCCSSFTIKAAEELGVPVVLFWPISAPAFLCALHFPHLTERGLVPLKDESCLTNGYLDRTSVDWIPGTKDIRLRDFPSFIRTTDPNDLMFNLIKGEVVNSYKASAIVVNTFDALDHDILEALSLLFPALYTIGPLPLLVDQIPDPGNCVKAIGSNLWKEDLGCLQWLDSKDPNSVVYVNFGSITVMTPQQLVEFAWGLANSKKTFLWIIRPDLVAGESAVLPPEFVTETKERGMLTSWCPQEQVLRHPSIGGFLTHCGWNSTMESLCSGVPLICWPFFADQQTTCRYACVKWGVGMEIDSEVERDKVEKLVRELMEGERGKEMKNKAMMWKRRAEEASDGSANLSCCDLDKLVMEVLSKRKI